MNRLQQKCILASAGVHLLLALILLTCPAFLAPKSKPSDITPITFYPYILIDQPFSNPGASAGSRSPAPAPAPTPTPPAPVVRPAPAPLPQPTKEPEPVVTPPKVNTESVEVTKAPARKRPNISLTAVPRPSSTKPKPRETPTEDPQQQARLERRERALNAFGRAASNIKSGTGSAIRIDPGNPSGGDGSGAAYASYASWVWSFFDKCWVRPEDATSQDATVEVTVTIASDGTVIGKRITQRSGDAAVDASVQRMLDHVTTVQRPFPAGARDKERTYIIPFNMKTNRGSA